MCSAANLNWPMKIRSVNGISEMATTHDIVNDVLLKDKLVQMWPDIIKVWLRLCPADDADNVYILEPHYKCHMTSQKSCIQLQLSQL